MAWPDNPRPAKAIHRFRQQINQLAPNRSVAVEGGEPGMSKEQLDRVRLYGGTLGDSSHQTRKSDHNPNEAGAVLATDITHDPKSGMNTYTLADDLAEAGRSGNEDKRLRYIISKGRITGNADFVKDNPNYKIDKPWEWGKYTGTNPHDSHIHIGLEKDPVLYDDDSFWNLAETPPGADGPDPIMRPILRRGSKGEAVKELQRLLFVDGDFGAQTEAALKAYQRKHGLEDDGIAGPYTWRKLLGTSSAPIESNEYRSLVPGGFFSSNPTDRSVNTSIRTNNPGAINTATWVQQMPGYASASETTPGNKTAIFYTPEQGVAAWWELLRRYADAGATTLSQIINRYGGGQDYSEYRAFVVKQTGLPAGYEIKLRGDDANLLKFAKAMFRYEAGKPTPLSDVQILYGIRLARNEITAESTVAGPVAMNVQPSVPSESASTEKGSTMDMDISMMLVRYGLVALGMFLVGRGVVTAEGWESFVTQVTPILGTLITAAGSLWGLYVSFGTKRVPANIAADPAIPTVNAATGQVEPPSKYRG